MRRLTHIIKIIPNLSENDNTPNNTITRKKITPFPRTENKSSHNTFHIFKKLQINIYSQIPEMTIKNTCCIISKK